MNAKEKKAEKKDKLLESAYKLFTEKGTKNTSIQDIVDDADVAKGTFYFYFKDKEEIKNLLIREKTKRLFNEALEELNKNYISNFSDKIIFIINYVINKLNKNKVLLKFISKNLSWGIYTKALNDIYDRDENDELGMYTLFLKEVKENNIKLENPEVTLFMIIELVSSTCFNSILYSSPLPIEEFKPLLYKEIRKMIE